jgi:CRP-like cAMP-binding protein
MSKLGYGLDWRQAIVLGYAGLRGAVSLILSVIVFLDHDLHSDVREIIIFHTAGIAIMTLIINGTTTGWVVRKLGLMRMSNVKKKMLKNLIKAYRLEVNEVLEELKTKKNFGKIEWEVLKKIACTDKIRQDIFKNRNIDEEASDLQASSQFRDEDIIIDNKEYTDEELYLEAKHRYLTQLKGIYWEFFEQGQCSSRAVLILIESSNRALDHAEDPLKDFSFLQTYFQASVFLKVLLKLKKVFIFKPFVKSALYNTISFNYDVIVNYVEAHEECLHLIHQIVQNEKILERLEREVREELQHAENKLYNDIEENFSEVTKAVQHKRGGYYLINKMRNFVTEMIEHGQIDLKEAKFFLHRLNKEERNLYLNKLRITFEEADLDFQSHCELAKIFSKDQLDQLCQSFKETHFNTGDLIIKKGGIIRNLVYISKGVVHEKNGDLGDNEAPKVRNVAGDILGLQFMTKDEGRSFTNCYAKSICTCQVFPVEALRNVIASKEQEKKIWNYIGPAIIQLNPEMFSRLQELDAIQIKALLKNSEYRWFEKGERITLENGGILFEGVLEEFSEGEYANLEDSVKSESERNATGKRKAIVRSYAFIYPTTTTYVAREDVRMFMLPEVLRESWLTFNPQVFADAFSVLPGGGASMRHQSTLRDKQATYLKKQKTTLLGIPKELAYNNPIQTYRGMSGNRGRQNLYAIGIPEGFQQQMREGTILPKGYTRLLSKLPPVVDHPVDNKVSEMNKAKEEHKVNTKRALEDSKESENTSTNGASNGVKSDDVKLKEKKGNKIQLSSEEDDEEGESASDEGDEEVPDSADFPQTSEEHLASSGESED